MTHYDADPAVEAFARPVRDWAKSGFLRGLAGLGGVVPAGRVAMPSSAFLEASHAELAAVGDEAERLRREAYVAEVHGRLTGIQSACVAEHFRLALLGRLADIVIAAMAIATFLLVLDVASASHPATLCLLGLVAVKLAIAQLSIRKSVRLSEAAFSANDIPVSFPWSRANPVPETGPA